jgi:hypothetical protein
MSNVREFDVSLDNYEILNLFGLLMRATQFDNGDWYGQFKWKLADIIRKHPNQFPKDGSNNFNDIIDMDNVTAMAHWGLDYKNKIKEARAE